MEALSKLPRPVMGFSLSSMIHIMRRRHVLEQVMKVNLNLLITYSSIIARLALGHLADFRVYDFRLFSN